LREDPDLRARLVRHALRAAEQFQATTVAAHLRNVVSRVVIASTEQQPAPIRGNMRTSD
jgi:hypothetical protein